MPRPVASASRPAGRWSRRWVATSTNPPVEAIACRVPNSGSPALPMRSALLRSGTTENPLENEDRYGGLAALDHRECGRTQIALKVTQGAPVAGRRFRPGPGTPLEVLPARRMLPSTSPGEGSVTRTVCVRLSRGAKGPWDRCGRGRRSARRRRRRREGPPPGRPASQRHGTVIHSRRRGRRSRSRRGPAPGRQGSSGICRTL